MVIEKAFNDRAWRIIPQWLNAAGAGDMPELHKSLQQGMKVDAQGTIGTTALQEAIRGGKEDAVQFLLAQGADIAIRNRSGWSALDYAVARGLTALARELIERGADPSAANPCNAPFISWCGTPSHFGLNLGVTPLMVAAKEGRTDALRLLIDCKVDINAADKWGRTALDRAAEAGNLAEVRMLLDSGADPDHEDAAGWTPLMQAARHGFPGIVSALLERVDPAKEPSVTCTWSGFTDTPSKFRALDNALLLAAISPNSAEIVKLLADKGANVNVRQSAYGGSALYMAAQDGRADTVRFLLDRGADPNITNFNGVYPEGTAEKPEIRAMIREVRERRDCTAPAGSQLRAR